MSAPLLHHARYEPGEVLGRGAQGVVLAVVDREAPRRALVAKVYAPGALSEEMLRGEFALLSRLRVCGLVRAHDLGRDDHTGAAFLVEDRVHGPDARKWIASAKRPDGAFDAPLAQRRLIQLVADVATTLATLHDAGFVHGDLKPAHVRIVSDRPVLLDLGAAVVASASAGAGPAARRAIVGTRGFVAPEVVGGAEPTPASDLFALGATVWAAAAGTPPPSPRGSLRDRAPWVHPTLDDLVDALLAEHPRDRPFSARAVLERLGSVVGDLGIRIGAPSRSAASLIGRDAQLSEALSATNRVTYLVGDSGMGKSHFLREMVTRSLLAGRPARFVSLSDDSSNSAPLIPFLRGNDAACPFRLEPGPPFLVALDDLERAPEELGAALEAFRCRSPEAAGIVFVASARQAPSTAPRIELGHLDDRTLDRIAATLGEGDARTRSDAIRSARGNPGWLVSTLAGVPLTKQAVLSHLGDLSPSARTMLATVALCDPDAPATLCDAMTDSPSKDRAELMARGLVIRARGDRGEHSAIRFALAVPGLRTDLVDALVTFELADRVAAELFDGRPWPARLLLAVARAPTPPERRADLLRAAAIRARAEGLRSLETDALLALAADRNERSAPILESLDRLTRGVGSSGLHPEVLGWLEGAAEADERLRPLALRRRADHLARSGDYSRAHELALESQRLARQRNDPSQEALALSMQGAIALYRGDWGRAGPVLAEARDLLERYPTDDTEELARLDHNLGVVALYEERTEAALEALERSLSAKRQMGDRGGVWACLLNVGLALSKAGRFGQAAAALDEAVALTRSLGQTAGTGWCLAARAEVEIKRGDGRAAERAVAQAESLGSALPASVRADLAVARGQIALLDGDGALARRALGTIDDSLRRQDALTDARALVVEAGAWLTSLPVQRLVAARRAIAAIRRARAAALPEIERQGIETLRRARSKRPAARAHPTTPPPAKENIEMREADKSAWPWLERLEGGCPIDDAATSLAHDIVQQAAAERAFIALAGPGGAPTVVWGADLDGLAIARAAERVDLEAFKRALGSDGPVYQRGIDTAGGAGSRLAIAARRATPTSPRAVVVVEHRFVPDRFDAIEAETCKHWATLAALLGRMGSPSEATDTGPSVSRPDAAATLEASTSIPLGGPRRVFPTLIGSSPAMTAALARLDTAVDSDLPVLLTGETGVGKELFARALHDHGRRKSQPFVAVSCGAIPETLFEAELFGHAKGSFTGADRARGGLIARAEGGTLFLDEIGELPVNRQAVLLRALEAGTYRAVGTDQDRAFDVRIVAATNRDLAGGVRDGTFRRDLLYRLNVLEIQVPPLRERGGDIALLVRHFTERENGNLDISMEALESLESYAWPGNVRELEHQIQRLVATRARRILRKHLPREIRRASGARPTAIARKTPRRTSDPETERAEVTQALEVTGGNITRAAEKLGITRHGLKKRMLRLGMRAPQNRATPGRGA